MTDDKPIPQFGAEARRALFHERVLVLDGPLDDDNGTLLMTQLLSLAAEDPVADIALWIHSPGGSVPAMLGIRDIIHAIPNDVATVALGLACSAGQFLLSAGTKGKRRALAHSRILLHQGSSGIGGSAVEIEVQADDLAPRWSRCSRTTPGARSRRYAQTLIATGKVSRICEPPAGSSWRRPPRT